MTEFITCATGKRKNAVARVWLAKGEGKFLVNKKPVEEYIDRASLKNTVFKPLRLTGLTNEYDVYTTVNGGGISGQAGAIAHGISRALINIDEGLRESLKKSGLLTRDPRAKERKKYGQKKARKKFQWTKR